MKKLFCFKIKKMDVKKNYLLNIRSKYIFDALFLDEKQKLKMIIYNKQLQAKFGVDIKNYKKISGKYKIGEKKGIVEEYNLYTNLLVFKGEYLNGKRNGKGKDYYDNGKVEFEGNYLNGNRHGKGKEYDYEGNLRHEGEYLNGKRKGEEYYNSGNPYGYRNILRFKGEYLNGKKWNGNIYNPNGKICSEIKEGRGHIKEYHFDHLCKLKYEGEYLYGERNGKGKEYYFDGKVIFEGEYINGERHGEGKEFFDDGKVKFEGEYLYGNIWNGKGYDKTGNIAFEVKEGSGYIKKYNYFGKLQFEGQYLKGLKNGKGISYYNNNKISFEGEYLNGNIWSGKGYNIEGDIAFEIKDGEGYVKEYNDFGYLVYEGKYSKGKRKGKEKQIGTEKSCYIF